MSCFPECVVWPSIVDERGPEIASNTRMEQPPHTEQRLTDLEIKASFNEDLVEHLNQLVARQQAQIELLMREVSHLRQQGPSGDAGVPRSLRDELPPHY
jgi:SlyX protein